ncbi:Potassium-transporting ATPase A chain [Rhynchospora pubera]|uniref:Potassium-transporting ATPase A chain n=1 Tax=Rhynchospora pubera TaxID=906938 RepID=A0AAV8EKW3_9POAL|nr:Potassium-transporting ATPase A chain [Rhynchospora pubera]
MPTRQIAVTLFNLLATWLQRCVFGAAFTKFAHGAVAQFFFREYTERTLQLETKQKTSMAITNFILTVAGVTAAVILLRGDVKQSASIFRRNLRHIRHWLEEESTSAAKSVEKSAPKELNSQAAKKETPKDEKSH